MYKVLIADDEKIIRNGISKLLCNDKELEIVGLAEDGEIALDIATSKFPDIALVDINMPFLNGLEFIAKLRQVQCNIVVIIITGYDTFSYAQKALRLGVFDYLLKPVSQNLLFETINKAKIEVDCLKEKIHRLEWTDIQLSKNRREEIRLLLHNLFEGLLTPNDVIKRVDELKLSLPQSLGVVVMKLGLILKEYSSKKADLKDFYISECINEIHKDENNIMFIDQDKNNIVVLIEITDDNSWEKNISNLINIVKSKSMRNIFSVSFIETDFNQIIIDYHKAILDLEEQSLCTKLIIDAKNYIDDNYSNSMMSLHDIASAMHVSAQYLSRQFHLNTGNTLVDYISSVRIKKSMWLLEHSDYKVYEIAESVGYSTQHYFSAAFKKIKGCSPADYRKTIKTRSL